MTPYYRLPPVPAPVVIPIECDESIDYLHEVCGKLADITFNNWVPKRPEGTYPDTHMWCAEDN